MSWKHPLHPAQVSGQGLMTKDKPIRRIHEAVHEIQQKTVTKADIKVLGLNLSSCKVRGNQLFIRGAIEGGVLGYGGSGGGVDSGDLEDRVSDLENKLSGMTLENTLSISGGSIVLDTVLTLGDGTRIRAAQQTIPLVTCGAFAPV